MRFPLKSLAAVVLALGMTGLASAQRPIDSPSRPLKGVMQLKLEYSKQILEGLALEDHDKITKNAQALGLLSLESGWKILQTEEYAKQSMEFRRTTDAISKASRDKNVDRAALGYVSLTVRCIECHSYLRQQQGGLPLTDERTKHQEAKKK